MTRQDSPELKEKGVQERSSMHTNDTERTDKNK